MPSYVERHIPSLKTLNKAFKGVARDRLHKLRTALEEWRDHKIQSRSMLEIANSVLGGHGVEHLRGHESVYEPGGAYYINMGDPYITTILLDLERSRVWITGWGLWLEAEEHGGAHSQYA